MKNLINGAVANKKITLMAVIMLVVMGIFSYNILPKQEYPDASSPAAIVAANAPGMSPEDMEELVVEEVEDAARELDGYDHSFSSIGHGVASTIIVFDFGFSEEEIRAEQDEVRRLIEDVEQEMIADVNLIVDTDFLDETGFILAISGEEYSREQLVVHTENLRREIDEVGGVMSTEVIGDEDEELQVIVDLEKASSYPGLTISGIAQIIGSQNTEIPSGNLDAGEEKINIRTPGMYNSVDEIENTVIYTNPENNTLLRLKDVAEINFGDESDYRIAHNKEEAIFLTGYFHPDENVVHIGDDVAEEITRAKTELPEGIDITKVNFQPEDVSGSITEFILNLIQGVLILVAIIALGMGKRNAVVVAAAIPLTILITFSVMYGSGQQLHMISIAGLIMSLGLLVDNAVVVSDSIQLRLDEGQERFRSCIEGTRETAIPVLSATLTTVIAFVPLLFLPGAIADFFGGIPRTIITALIVSYVVAVLVVPTLANMLFRPNEIKNDNEIEEIIEDKTWNEKNAKKDSKENSKEGEKVHSKKRKLKFNPANIVSGFQKGRFKKVFSGLLEISLRKKKTALVIAFLVLVGAFAIAGELPAQLLPYEDTDVIYMDVEGERAYDIDHTERLINQIEEVLVEEPEITNIASSSGGPLPRFEMAAMPRPDSPNFGQILMHLDLEKGNRFENNTQIVEYLQDTIDREVAGGEIQVNQLGMAGEVAPIEARISGEEFHNLEAATETITRELDEIEGTINVNDNLGIRQYDLVVDADLDAVMYSGLNRLDLQQTVSSALQGVNATTFLQDGAEHPVLVKGDVKSRQDLENLKVVSPETGRGLLLGQLAEFKLSPQMPSINRFDAERTVSVTSDVRWGYNPIEIQTELENIINDTELEGVSVDFEGEEGELGRRAGDLGIAAIVAVFMIFIVLMVQFNSMAQPFIIMVTIPFSAIGTFLALYLTNQPLSLFGMLGIVSLIGVVVNNAIVLIDYINRERRNGLDVEAACKSAVVRRFRPVMLTMLTTVMGLIPLALSGNDLFVPMAVAFMGGLITSTFVTLNIIPVVYSLIIRDK